MSSFPVAGLFQCYSPDCCQIWLSPSLTGGNCIGYQCNSGTSTKNNCKLELYVESDWSQFIGFADLKFWSQSAIDVSSSSCPHICWLAEFMLVRRWCQREVMVLPFVLWWGVSSTRGTCSGYLVKTVLACSIGICWLTVGSFLGEPGSKLVHV